VLNARWQDQKWIETNNVKFKLACFSATQGDATVSIKCPMAGVEHYSSFSTMVSFSLNHHHHHHPLLYVSDMA
jgi:hypothetical protein